MGSQDVERPSVERRVQLQIGELFSVDGSATNRDLRIARLRPARVTRSQVREIANATSRIHITSC